MKSTDDTSGRLSFAAFIQNTSSEKTTSPSRRNIENTLQAGDIVKIVRGEFKGVFLDGLAKIDYILNPIKVRRVRGKEIAIVKPREGDPTKEVQEYLENLQKATGERILARVYGYTASGDVLRREEKVNVKDVEKMPANTPLPTRKRTQPHEKVNGAKKRPPKKRSWNE